MGKYTEDSKKGRVYKNTIFRIKDDKIKSAVKNQVKEIFATSKSYDDQSKDILQVVKNRSFSKSK